jgi:hypothetical protein
MPAILNRGAEGLGAGDVRKNGSGQETARRAEVTPSTSAATHSRPAGPRIEARAPKARERTGDRCEHNVPHAAGRARTRKE